MKANPIIISSMQYLVAGIVVALISKLFSFWISLFSNHFATSYAEKKGENLATKQDVTEITDKV